MTTTETMHFVFVQSLIPGQFVKVEVCEEVYQEIQKLLIETHKDLLAMIGFTQRTIKELNDTCITETILNKAINTYCKQP